MLSIYDVGRRRLGVADVMSLAWTAGVLLLTHVLSARGEIRFVHKPTLHPLPDRVKPSFVIFDRVPGCQKLQMTA